MKSNHNGNNGRRGRKSIPRNGKAREGQFFHSELAVDSSPAEPLDLGVDILGRFRPEERVGSGNSATVYKAYDLRLCKDIALKVASGAAGARISGLDLLGRELAIHRRLPHIEHLIRLDDLYSFEKAGAVIFFLAVEYAEGGTLRRWMSASRRACKQRRRLGWPLFLIVVAAYAALQDEGLVLLDAKPENVLLVGGQPKVSDIGRAICRNPAWRDVAELDIPNDARGTRAYMSPEQAAARGPEALGPQSDVYSLATMGYERMHPRGDRPFEPSPEHLVDGPPAYRGISGVSGALNRTLERGLCADPKRRYPDLRAFLKALRACEESGSEPDSARAAAPFPEARSGDSGRPSRETSGGKTNPRTAHRLPKPEPRQMVVRREEASRICQQVLSESPPRDLDSMRDFLLQVEQLYPEHPDLELGRLKLDFREKQYRKERGRGWQALQGMDVELARRHFLRALESNPGDERLQRALQLVELLLDRLISSIRGGKGRRRPNSPAPFTRARGEDEEDLDTLAVDTIEVVGELLGLERDDHG